MRKEKSTKMKVETLKKQLSSFLSDSSLLTNLSCPLLKVPEERTELDNLVLQNLDEAIAEQDKKFAAVLAEGEPARSAREKALNSAQARFDDADAKVRQLKADLKAAEGV